MPEPCTPSVRLDRRRFISTCTAAGLGHTLFPGALLTLATSAAEAQSATPESTVKITAAMIDHAATIAGVLIAQEQKAMMLDGLNNQLDDIREIRKLPLPNSVAPAFHFDPVPPRMVLDTAHRPMRISQPPAVSFTDRGTPEANADELAFMTVRELAELVRTKRVSSTTLTRMYLSRLKRFDPQLHFVITLLEDRALKQAAQADAEIAAGRYRGPLHGIPWGVKDLVAVAGYPTTWGAAGFEDQHFAEDAEVVKRLDAAGAVLVAKLTLGALAQGDLWGYPGGSGSGTEKRGGRTRNPWNTRQGSSGSSAGSASAVSAGCVAFALGTETLGSISSPSTRCGVTGLRPTFGFVPRTGAMALSWTMDKIGPITRSVEDCAIVLSTIHGQDGQDRSVQPAAFNWDAEFDWRTLRIGHIKSAFDAPVGPELKAPTAGGDAEMEAFRKRQQRVQAGLARAAYDLQYATAALSQITKMGVTLIPVEIPKLPWSAMVPVLEAEGAAAFDDLTRSGRDHLLAGQQPFDWPNNFRVARFYPAVDYIQSMRARTLGITAMAELFRTVDVIVTPSQGAQLTATNLTGYPAVIVPNGLRGPDAPPSPNDGDGAVDNAGGPGTPVSLTFLGNLYADAKVAAFARAYQQRTGFHKLHPKLG